MKERVSIKFDNHFFHLFKELKNRTIFKFKKKHQVIYSKILHSAIIWEVSALTFVTTPLW